MRSWYIRSDVVDHSLIQTDTAPAVLQVEEDGTMRLSYRMVSGTDQEPMYILGFNGYYIDNEDSGELSMEGVTFRTEEAGEYQVVTQVSVPLPGNSAGITTIMYTSMYRLWEISTERSAGSGLKTGISASRALSPWTGVL